MALKQTPLGRFFTNLSITTLDGSFACFLTIALQPRVLVVRFVVLGFPRDALQWLRRMGRWMDHVAPLWLPEYVDRVAAAALVLYVFPWHYATSLSRVLLLLFTMRHREPMQCKAAYIYQLRRECQYRFRVGGRDHACCMAVRRFDWCLAR